LASSWSSGAYIEDSYSDACILAYQNFIVFASLFSLDVTVDGNSTKSTSIDFIKFVQIIVKDPRSTSSPTDLFL
jgi:hypothetical protein